MPTRPRSPLDAFFDPPDDPVDDPVDAAVAVARAVRSLVDTQADPRARSHGEVTSPETFIPSTGRPEPRGLFSERIFGPVTDMRCACGKYDGDEHAGETCERCRVTVESSEVRNWRFGHVETGPLLHPTLVPAVAEILGITVEQVRAVLRTEAEWRGGHLKELTESAVPEAAFTGVTGLKRAVEAASAGAWHQKLLEAGLKVDALFIEAVPVLPPGDRLPIHDEGDPRAKVPTDGTVNEAYGDLVYQSRRFDRMVELEAPDILVVDEQARLQQALEALLEQVEKGNQPGGWERLPDDGPGEGEIAISTSFEDAVREQMFPGRAHELRALLWLDDGTLLEQRGRELRVRDLNTGDTRHLEAPPFPMRSIHDGLVVFCDDMSLPITDHGDSGGARAPGFAALDLETGELRDTLPDGIPLYTVTNDQPEELFLFDIRHDRCRELPVGSDRPQMGAYSREARYALVFGDGEGGQIVELHTGRVLEDLSRLDLRHRSLLELGEDGTPTDPGTREGIEARGAPALHLTEDEQWQWLTAAGTVGCGDESFYRLAFCWEAAAFSPRGDRLAVLLESGEVLLLDPRQPGDARRL